MNLRFDYRENRGRGKKFAQLTSAGQGVSPKSSSQLQSCLRGEIWFLSEDYTWVA